MHSTRFVYVIQFASENLSFSARMLEQTCVYAHRANFRFCFVIALASILHDCGLLYWLVVAVAAVVEPSSATAMASADSSSMA